MPPRWWLWVDCSLVARCLKLPENQRFVSRRPQEVVLRDLSTTAVRFHPALAVALNCGTGSSFLNALVNAFDRFHIVLAANSGYCGSKYNRWTSGSRVLGASRLPSMSAE